MSFSFLKDIIAILCVVIMLLILGIMSTLAGNVLQFDMIDIAILFFLTRIYIDLDE